MLLTVDIEKTFDSVNLLFSVSALEKYGFKNDFIRWTKLLLKNQESCIINGGQITKYFKLERGTRQGDPSQPAIACSKLTIETLEQGVKYVQS